MNRARANEWRAQAKQLRRENGRLAAENLRLKADRDRGDLPELDLFRLELGHLVEAADPTRGRNIDSTPSSADRPGEGEATRWFRSRLDRYRRWLVKTTADIQADLETPAAERVTVDVDGKCVTCGRRRQPKVRVSRT